VRAAPSDGSESLQAAATSCRSSAPSSTGRARWPQSPSPIGPLTRSRARPASDRSSCGVSTGSLSKAIGPQALCDPLFGGPSPSRSRRFSGKADAARPSIGRERLCWAATPWPRLFCPVLDRYSRRGSGYPTWRGRRVLFASRLAVDDVELVAGPEDDCPVRHLLASHLGYQGHRAMERRCRRAPSRAAGARVA
jgi:hypothetical protein